ncbi:hypothetical protein B484DRAFT_175664 [Ochromonadaceae sp. CCMP2298]|nr:hypothetical protein B484DRAFT_175664 [Ochromonadaceae sp. CCMP2298]
MYEVVEDEYFLIDVMEALADHSPREYEKLICSIRLMPVKGNRIPLGSNFLVRNSRTRNMELRDDLDRYVYVCMCICVCRCVYLCMYVCVSVYADVCIYVCRCVYVSMCVWMYVCI